MQCGNVYAPGPTETSRVWGLWVNIYQSSVYFLHQAKKVLFKQGFQADLKLN